MNSRAYAYSKAQGLRRLIPYVREHLRWIMLGLFCLAAADALALLPPWILKKAIDGLGKMSGSEELLGYAALILLVAFLQACFRYGWRTSLFGVARHVEYKMRKELFGALQRLERAFYLERSIGDVMSRCTNDLVAVQELIAFVGLLVVDSSLTILSCVVLMAWIDPELTLAALLPLPLLSVCFMYFGRRVKDRALQVQAQLAELTQGVQEILSGIRVIQAYTMEKAKSLGYQEACTEYLDKQMELARLRGVFYGLLGFLAGGSFVIVLGFGGKSVAQGRLTLGSFVAFNSYLLMLSWPMMSLGFMVNLLQRARASLQRIGEVLEARPAVASPSRPAPLEDPLQEIRFEEVGVKYAGSDVWALKGINLRLPAGMKVGVTGPVGSGKTTLLELLPRIQDPTEGRVLINGLNIKHLSLEDLRSKVVLVAQEPFLFSESLASNVWMGKPGQDPSMLDRLARIACLERDISLLPQGWDTLVGERGVMLSGGQRQRVALARALALCPWVLLLDDAFAHLDAQTELEILQNLLSNFPDMTQIFVSHRLSTLMKADWVIVLGQGSILEQGSPVNLLEGRGYFQRLARQQEILKELEAWPEGEPR
jgi:ATP-binding cassette subfamily B multidrug efflux pump